MYMFRIDHITYDRTRDGQPLTLAEAFAEVYGCAGAAVVRADGTVVVRNAGNATAVTYAPTGRTITRRRARHLRYSPACRADGNHGRCSGWVTGAHSANPCQCHTCGCTRRRTPADVVAAVRR